MPDRDQLQAALAEAERYGRQLGRRHFDVLVAVAKERLEFPTPDQIEAAARALEEASGPPGYRVTDELWERYCDAAPDKVARLREWAEAALLSVKETP